MKMVLKIALCCCLTAAAGMAQRGGGGHGGGMGGGGMRGGGGMGGGGMRGGGMGGGGWRGGGIGGGGWRGGTGWGGGWRGGNWGWRGNGWGWRGNGWGWRGGNWGWGWPGWGWGLGWGGGWGWGGGVWPASSFVWDSSSYWPGYADISYGGGPSYASSGYPQGYPQQQPGSNVTVIYPPQSPQVTVNPVVREYDQFGQQIGGPVPSAPANTAVGNAGSTLFLIALHDHSIRAAVAYWVQGNTLHFVTTEHETKMVPLDSVDRDLSRQLNAERRVQFSLPSR